MTPNAVKQSKVYSIIPSNGNGDLTFTRGTLASSTLTNDAGLIEIVPYNLTKYSEDFSNSISWSLNSSTLINNFANSPNGTGTADKIYPTSTGLYRGIFQIAFPIQTCNVSVYAKSSGKNWMFFYAIGAAASNGVWFDLVNGVVGAVNSSWSNAVITDVGNGWYRCSATITITNATNNLYYLTSDGNNNTTATTNGTDGIILWGAQVVQGSTPKDYFYTTDRLNVPRLNYDSVGGCPSLLLEPLRTNSIRNSTMQGAVVGTPGTLPTNWAQGGGGGALTTRTIVGTGIENGLTYIDIRYQGVNAGQYRLVNESGAIQSAVVGNNITFSSYIKLISGTAPQLQLVISNRDSLNAFISDNNGTLFNLTSTLTRYIYSANIQQVGTAYAQPIIQWSFSGTTYDFTIRVAGSQIELGAYPTSYIPTTTGIVTRNGDGFTRNSIFTNGLITSAGGTWFIELNNNIAYIRDTFVFALYLGDSLFNNYFTITFGSASPNTPIIRKKTSLTIETQIASITTPIAKIAIKWNRATADVFINGSNVVSATAFNFTAMEVLSGSGADTPKSIKSTMLFPTPLTDSECIAITQ